MISGLSNLVDDGLIVRMDGSRKGADPWHGMEKNAISILSTSDG